MSISFSGLASGLDTKSWVDALVSVKQQKITTFQKELKGYQNTKTSLNDTKNIVTSLRSAIERLTDTKFGGTFDLFSQNIVKSSNEEIFTATAGTNARRQNYDITVQQLATFTKAISKESASAIADGTTPLKNIGISKGSFTAYVDGAKNKIDIAEDDTFEDLVNKLDECGISTNIDENGVVHFTAKDSGKDIHIGATTDTSNFSSLLGLERKEDGSYASTNSLFKVTVATKLTEEDSGFKTQITKGTFTIGNAEFTIDEDTTLSSLISQINSNKNAQAYAYWDDTTGKLSITSTKEGASYINIEAGTSNFTDVMGFTNSEWDEEGNLLSSTMYTENQELGKNAMFTINGTSMTSTSNTVTADISRIDGVTITLHRTSTEDDGKTTLQVDQDTSGLKDALNNFVKAYNETMAKIDEVTGQGASLHGESSLTSLQRTLRNFVMGRNDSTDGIYKMLSEIGISTGKADNDLNADTSSLHFDESKFLQALEENPEAVQSLLIGEGSVLSMMEDTVEQSLKAASGFFDIKNSTLDSNIKRVNEKITAKNKSIETYKAQLEAKFQAMEKMISSMQQNYSSFLS